MMSKLKRLILGDPLASHREKHERLGVPLALAVFAADALSSTAYATEEILIALCASSFAAGANPLSIPVSLAIGVLMALVVISYRQVIWAYPQGGGTYEVSKERLGTLASQIAGAALLIDYVLTVAVSISAGVAALTSTGWVPIDYKVPVALFFLLFIMFLNLRGVRESGKAIAVPAYIFLGSMLVLVCAGSWQLIVHPVPCAANIVGVKGAEIPTIVDNGILNVALVLALLNAFSHGCAALTGIEAVSNGVKAFKEPAPVNANTTLVWMGCILGFIFIGMTILANGFHITPNPSETVLSQIARHVFPLSGNMGWMYYVVQIFTMIILILAANTSYAGFPRLATILASDGFLPRQLMSLGDRLVFSNGILILSATAFFLILFYQADTHALIPLYAVGVFLSFTLAQVGMVMHHRLNRDTEGWQWGIGINGLGAIVTAIVTIILMVEKFFEGAWIVAIAIPLLIVLFRSIHAHYRSIGRQLALPEEGYCPLAVSHTVLVLVSSLNRGTIPALEYGKTISTRLEAVHIELKPEATDRLKKAWDQWGCGIPLTILKSPYRSITQPLLDYIDEVDKRYENNLVTIIVPEFVTKKWWHILLHNQTAILIKALLRFRRGKVVTTVRYYLEE